VKLFVTGGAGFIGTNFVRYVLANYPDDQITVYDKLTYAGNPENLKGLDADPRYRFVKGDICDAGSLEEALRGHDAVVHAGEFVRTNVVGANTIFDVARRLEIPRFLHISTDETYGSIQKGSFKEGDALEPASPYSAAKAGADLLAHAYWVTFGYPIMVTRSSNNFGPYQYPEKLIPLFITNLLDGAKVPVYGDGLNVRDWIHAEDNCSGLDTVLRHGEPGEIYNIGGGNELTNLELTHMLLGKLGRDESFIEYVADRLGHDRRYSIDCTKARALGWKPRWTFPEALDATVQWYVENRWWWEPLKPGSARVVEHDLETPDDD
jgi:dTDP-glucose 4,6-dehydratase